MHVLGNVRLRRMAREAARLRRPLAAVAVTITVAAAMVTTGSSATAATAAAALPMPTVEETVKSTVQNAHGTWTVTYDIVVTNTDGSRATEYDLADTLEFGAGLTVSTATVTAPSGAAVNPDWTGVDDTTIVANRTITADAIEHYTVTVTGAVTAATSNTDRDCAVTNGERGTGFLNRAAVLVGSRIATSTACAVVAALATSGLPISGTDPTDPPVQTGIPSSNPGGDLAYTGIRLGDLVSAGIGFLIIGIGLLLLIGRRRKDSRPVR